MLYSCYCLWADKTFLARRSRNLKITILNLEKPVDRMYIAQPIDPPSYMKKLLITNKVTMHFFITLFESIAYTLHTLSTDPSRLNQEKYIDLRSRS